MTVGDLIYTLSQYDRSMKVGLTYDYGDYLHTDAVSEIDCAQEHQITVNDNIQTRAISHPRYRDGEKLLDPMIILSGSEIELNYGD